MKTKTLSLLNLVVVLLFSMPSYSNAQKCEVKADPITGEKVIQFINKHKTLRYENKGTELTDMYMTFSYPREQNVSVSKGSNIIIKLKNDKIITLETITDANPQSRLVGEQIVTFYTYAFKLSKEQIDNLASDKISLIRYPSLDGGTLDWQVKGLGKIYASKVTKGAECISESL